MAYAHTYYELISYGGSLYAIGGYDGSETNIMERYTPGEGWVRMANMPHSNHRLGQGELEGGRSHFWIQYIASIEIVCCY